MRTMSDLLIIGAGGHGRVVADIASKRCANVAFLDDEVPSGDLPWPLLGSLALFDQVQADFGGFIVGVGGNAQRIDIAERLERLGGTLTSVVDPSAVVSPHAKIGSGTVVMPQAAINYGAELGRSCIVNTGATVDHDCRLGDGVHVSPGAHLAGGVTVGARAWIGVGASVREGVTVAEDVIVGAGAAVVGDLSPGSVVKGVPAR